jgi:uncharacterized protein YdaU (DUF1376 family)
MANKKLRPPPSYQEYASDLLANRHYMLMSLSEHGLFDVMRKQCWVNKSVPTDKEHMAKIIGCEVSEVEDNLSPHVLHFFIEKDGEFISPELEDYRINLMETRRKQVEGGKKGGITTQVKHKTNQGKLKDELNHLSRDKQSGEGLGGEESGSLESDVNENPLSEDSQKFVDEMNEDEDF